MRERGYAVTGFGDMSAEEVAALTGLPLDQAAMAKEREFDEPFLDDTGDKAEIERAAGEKGLAVSQGSILSPPYGRQRQGKAVAVVAGLFRKSRRGDLIFAAIGDGSDDLPMLEAVDRPIIVQRPDGTYDPHLLRQGLRGGGRYRTVGGTAPC